LFFKEIKFHWNIGPDNKAFPCRAQFGQDCFLCKALPAVAQKDAQLAKQMQARPRYYMNIIDMNNQDAGVQVYSCGKKALTDILSYIADPSWGDITHPQTGRNVSVERSGSGRNSNFTIRCEGSASAIDMSILDNLINLDSMIMMPSNEEMMKAFEPVAKALKEGGQPGPAISQTPTQAIPQYTSPSAPSAATNMNPPQSGSQSSPPTSFTPPTDSPMDEAAMEQQLRDLLGS